MSNETLPPDVWVISGPTRCTHLVDSNVWEIVVRLPVYSSKLALSAYHKLPDFVDFDGRAYRKGGMKSSDCTAYYRSVT